MGSIASRFQNYQFAPHCPEIQDEICTASEDNDDTNDSTVSVIENNGGSPGNEANIDNGDNSQTLNTWVEPSVNCPEIQDETGAVSDSDSGDSTVSMIENSLGIPENESNIINNENFLEPNTFNLDDISELSVRHADDLENIIDGFVDNSSVVGAASNMSESDVVRVGNTPRFAEDSRVVETVRTPKKPTLSKTGVAPLPQHRGASRSSSTLVLKNATTNKLITRRHRRNVKYRTQRASKNTTKKGLGICKFCKLKMRKTKRNTPTTMETRKHEAAKRKAKPFKIPKTVQTILKYTSDFASPKTNAYHNFLLYYNIRCNDARVSKQQRSACRKARHVWRMMNTEEKLPFSLLAQQERRKRLRQTQSLSKKNTFIY